MQPGKAVDIIFARYDKIEELPFIAGWLPAVSLGIGMINEIFLNPQKENKNGKASAIVPEPAKRYIDYSMYFRN